MTKARPTIYDVARLANVSKSLVSMVLRGDAGVSEQRRRAVLDAIATLDYRPSRAASALAGRRSHSIGVVIDDFRNLWFVDVLRGLREEFDAAGYRLTVSDQHRNAANEDPVDTFLSMHADGIVVAAEPGDLRARPITVPCVVVGDRRTRLAGADAVANDDEAGGRLATEHLLSLGHTRIGHITGAGGAAARRRLGYEEAMSAAGLEPIVVGRRRPTDEEGGYAGARELINAHPELTALFAANDTMAAGAFGLLRSRGLRVPQDISLMGYDNSPIAGPSILDLTTVDGEGVKVGVEAARLLLTRIDTPDARPSAETVQPRLVTRSSTTPPR